MATSKDNIRSWLEDVPWDPDPIGFEKPEMKSLLIHEDKASMSSRSSSRSVKSALAKERANQAELEARAEMFEEEQRIKSEQARIQSEQERINLQTEINVSRARQRVLLEEVRTMPVLTMNNDYMTASTPYCPNPVDLPIPRKQTTNALPSDPVTTREVKNIVETQIQLSDLILDQQRRSMLPRPEISKFNGDVLKYRTFIKSFENRIEKYAIDDSDKLHYLAQYTTDDPKEFVNSCLHMDPTEGFLKAKNMIKKTFGDDFKITQAYINELIKWPEMKSDSIRQLWKFSLQLLTCLNATTDISHLNDLNNPQNLVLLMRKLPASMQLRWLRKAHECKTTFKREATYKDFVDFVKYEVDVLCDPVFGKPIKHQDSNANVKQKQTFVTECVKPNYVNSNINNRKCDYCLKGHDLDFCREFIKLSYADRRNFVFANGMCFGCLRRYHDSRNCNAKLICRKCGKSHPTVLHSDSFLNIGMVPNQTASSQSSHSNLTSTNNAQAPQTQSRHRSTYERPSNAMYPPNANAKPYHPSSNANSFNVQSNANPPPINNYQNNGNKSGAYRQRVYIPNVENGCVEAAPHQDQDLVMSVVPVRVTSGDSGELITTTTYAFLDNGSSGCFISKDLTSKLNVKGEQTVILLGTMHGQSNINSSIIKNVQITDINGLNAINLPKLYTRDEIPLTTSKIPRPNIVERWDYLRNIDIPEYISNVDIGLLIGTNCPQALEPLQVIPSQNNGPYAVLTRLGWTVVGPVNAQTSSELLECNRIFIKDLTNDIGGRQVGVHHSVREVDTAKLFEHIVESDFVDYYCNDLPYSQEDKRFINIVNSETKFINGHYQVPLPFKDMDSYIPNNKQLAYKRLQSLKRKMECNPEFKHDYCQFVSVLLNNNYAIKIPNEQLCVPDGQVWYVPHHGIYHPRKPDKLRVVYDCSAKWKGVSLNDTLLQGPNLTSSLIGVLVRFREYPFAFMADIEKMFYQVNVPPSNWNYLRFLWWPDGNTEQSSEEYFMTVHIFGAVSSPSVSNFALQKIAEDNLQFKPEVLSSIKKDFYVDDLLKSCETEQEAITLAHDLIDICSRGGFNLTKFVSNSRDFIHNLPEDKIAKNIKYLDINYDDLPVEHCLGVRWCVESDMFSFNIKLKDKPFTRRGILSVVGSIYDPLGFLSPVTLEAKCILQELCALKIGWDDIIPDDSKQRWLNWRDQIYKLDQIQISRCIRPPDFGIIVRRELHLFSDASSTGYGSVGYERIVNDQGQIYCAFLIGKSRLALLQQKTIPRLELSAATISVKLSIMLLSELDVKPQSVTFWTDSTTVLQYIRNESKRFHVFVANRIALIRNETELEQWKYINTDLNPADLASRTVPIDHFIKEQHWFMGPEFLWTEEENWPSQPILSELKTSDPEVKCEISANVTINDPMESINSLFEHYSDWFRLKRSVAYILRLKDLLRKRVPDIKGVHDNIPQELVGAKREQYIVKAVNSVRNSSPVFKELNVNEINAAESAIVKYVQHKFFLNEVKILKDNLHNNAKKIVPKSSSLYKLDPVLSDNLLRVGGRLSNADLNDSVKHPLILPRHGHITELIVYDTHQSLAHAGRGHTIAMLREKYWLINANSVVRHTISKCVTCRKLRAPAISQKMSDLPKDRVTVAPIFARVGVDYFGPFIVKEGRKELKRYGVVFTCLSIRAIHIEIASSLDTSSFIHALRRFIARRGQCEEIRSDNGTNLCGGERELRLEIEKWNQHQINAELLQRNIKWIFNPPTASHHGGVWERQIRTIRKVLNALLSTNNNPRLNDESLCTFMCEVEAIVNSRPLTFTSDDPSDFNPLTPNMLLTMRSKWLLPPGAFQREDTFARKYWERVQYSDCFWSRWQKEYLLTLQERAKWSKPKRNLCINDIVLFVDESAPRNQWSLGRITDTVSDAHGLVRSATVKTQNSVLRRPISKLILLIP